MSRIPIRIPARFRGPPQMANGGFASGLLAAGFPGPCEVRLRAPIPLERDLERVDLPDGKRELRSGERVLAAAAPCRALSDPPQACDATRARAVAGQCRALRTHPFPGCFVCGPEREAADGLRIFPGVVAPDLVAAAWEPAPALDPADADVPEPVLWAALDCPTAFPLLEPDSARSLEPMVLGRLAAEILAPVPADAIYVVVAWTIERSERGGIAGSAVLDARGGVRARARATWVSMAGRLEREAPAPGGPSSGGGR